MVVKQCGTEAGGGERWVWLSRCLVRCDGCQAGLGDFGFGILGKTEEGESGERSRDCDIKREKQFKYKSDFFCRRKNQI
ncbi:hypothetical protein HanRHA438_Chr02g0049881 [Helianthus annuus]|nr:hypothetical protein HanIR_Chr02g0054441 [Helianthus annuus]KAJ0938440.1 hypothetical protein HanRHA438_Chr02g0049881 [Helianthus annuus]